MLGFILICVISHACPEPCDREAYHTLLVYPWGKDLKQEYIFGTHGFLPANDKHLFNDIFNERLLSILFGFTDI